MTIFWSFKSPFLQTGYWPVPFYSDEALQIGELFHSWFQLEKFLWGTRGTCNPNFQVVIMHALHVWSQHLFGLPVRMYGMHRTQFDDSRCNLLLLVIWSRKFDHAPFWSSVTWNFRKAQRWNKSVLTFDHCRSSSLAYINLPENKRNKK